MPTFYEMDLTSPPNGHQFQMESDDSSICLKWKHRPYDPLRFVFGAYYLVWFLAVLYMSVFNRHPAEPLFPLTFFLFAGSICLFLAYLLLMKNKSEVLTFSNDSLEFREGNGPISFINFYWMGRKRHSLNPMRLIHHKRRTFTFAKHEAARIVLEGFGQQQRLRFDDGAERIEIGEYLREPEREWLYAMIQAWEQSGENPTSSLSQARP